MMRIAFLGLGAMGSRMAVRLAAAGHAVTLWNRSADRAAGLAARTGCVTAGSPAEAVADAQVVVAMLRDDDASRAVWTAAATGALAAMPADAVAVECSTLTPAWVRDLARLARDREIAFVEAPLAGSLPQAEAGQLVFMGGVPPRRWHGSTRCSGRWARPYTPSPGPSAVPPC